MVLASLVNSGKESDRNLWKEELFPGRQITLNNKTMFTVPQSSQFLKIDPQANFQHPSQIKNRLHCLFHRHLISMSPTFAARTVIFGGGQNASPVLRSSHIHFPEGRCEDWSRNFGKAEGTML
ncbi:hypothetical protein CEXT_548151 [Caerostris extrusa]|uniref:Uncharacterized protein n=1 Tax=Caerostris extrusa TaxID=172846 RepID=A0AAV4YAW9_CAEEX|nr:hypothetical protein CEXT_548151 [Caerostris extrusa]